MLIAGGTLTTTEKQMEDVKNGLLEADAITMSSDNEKGGGEGFDGGSIGGGGLISLSDAGDQANTIAIGPPSPLTGCYLLIIIGEPHSAEHKATIVQKLKEGRDSTFH